MSSKPKKKTKENFFFYRFFRFFVAVVAAVAVVVVIVVVVVVVVVVVAFIHGLFSVTLFPFFDWLLMTGHLRSVRPRRGDSILRKSQIEKKNKIKNKIK